MKTGFYPGCSLQGSAREYNESVLAVAKFFGLEMEPIADWNCCGATAAHNLDKALSLSLPARVLALAERQGIKEIVSPCAACYSRLSLTRHELLSDEKLRKKISDILEMNYRGSAEVLNAIQMLDRYVVPHLEGKIKTPFDYKVACYYGCLMVRPPKVLKFDRPEDPQSMDILMKKIGADPIDWAFKVECCGAGFSVSRTDLVAKLSGQVMEDAVSRGAEAIVVACPMCHANLDMRRPEIEKQMGKKYSIPVIFITQALGMAIGIDRKSLGLHRHLVPVKWGEKKNLQTTAGVTA